jgi:hypothetical protein
MNILRTDYEDHTEIRVVDAKGQGLHCFTFDDKEEAKAFMNGWRCCQSVINGLVQSLPQSYDTVKA